MSAETYFDRVEMNRMSSSVYVVLLATFLYSNKYVLTVLGFQYPMVFQGWQTLVGFAIFKAMSAAGALNLASIPLDRAGFISLLPNFLFFTASVISGSKALSSIPLISFVAITNSLPAFLFLIDNFGDRCKMFRQTMASAVVLITAGALLVIEPREAFSQSPHFWLSIHVLCNVGLTMHGRIADARYNSVDRQYYNYIFALIVLAPASFYLEEAFEALHYEQRAEILFVVGSLVASSSGVLLLLYQFRLSRGKNFGFVHHFGRVVVATLGLGVFYADYTTLPCLAVAALNLALLPFVPTHILPDEEKLEGATTGLV